MRAFAGFAAVLFLTLSGAMGSRVNAQPSGSVVELESPLAASRPLHGLFRAPSRARASPAVVLLHSCNGNWRRLDERWGRVIASWGYVTLTVDSSLNSNCYNAAIELAQDAYRALDFLVRHPAVDPARVAALGFSQGGWLAMSSVERGAIERTATNKFRAAIAFYPPCRQFKDNMTVPTLILVGELDDWWTARECRNLVEGRDDYGISRDQPPGAPITLIVLPGAYHSFDSPNLTTPANFLGHHLEFNQAATDQSVAALREFLIMTMGELAKEKDK
jgi:dienelactone hydrolase